MFETKNGLSPIQLMLCTDRLHRSAVEQTAEKNGLHRSQLMLLMYLLKHEGQVCQSEIAESFRISPAAVAVTLKKLEAGGWIERRPTAGNARKNEIRLTEKSLSLAQDTCRAARTVDEIMCRGISEAEMAAFSATLIKMQENLRRAYPGTAEPELPFMPVKGNKA